MKRLPCIELLKEPEYTWSNQKRYSKEEATSVKTTLIGVHRWRLSFESQGGFPRWLWVADWQEGKRIKYKWNYNLVVATCFMILQQISGDLQNVQKGQSDLKSPRCWWRGNHRNFEVMPTQQEQVASPGWSMVAGRIWCSSCLGPINSG